MSAVVQLPVELVTVGEHFKGYPFGLKAGGKVLAHFPSYERAVWWADAINLDDAVVVLFVTVLALP